MRTQCWVDRGWLDGKATASELAQLDRVGCAGIRATGWHRRGGSLAALHVVWLWIVTLEYADMVWEGCRVLEKPQSSWHLCEGLRRALKTLQTTPTHCSSSRRLSGTVETCVRIQSSIYAISSCCGHSDTDDLRRQQRLLPVEAKRAFPPDDSKLRKRQAVRVVAVRDSPTLVWQSLVCFAAASDSQTRQHHTLLHIITDIAHASHEQQGAVISILITAIQKPLHVLFACAAVADLSRAVFCITVSSTNHTHLIPREAQKESSSH